MNEFEPGIKGVYCKNSYNLSIAYDLRIFSKLGLYHLHITRNKKLGYHLYDPAYHKATRDRKNFYVFFKL
jgi:hypothetical protein